MHQTAQRKWVYSIERKRRRRGVEEENGHRGKRGEEKEEESGRGGQNRNALVSGEMSPDIWRKEYEFVMF